MFTIAPKTTSTIFHRYWRADLTLSACHLLRLALSFQIVHPGFVSVTPDFLSPIHIPSRSLIAVVYVDNTVLANQCLWFHVLPENQPISACSSTCHL
jgi:hypothetical protein